MCGAWWVDASSQGGEGSCSWNGIQPKSFFNVSGSWVFLLVNVLISTHLMIDTRRKEVDGPAPPHPDKSNSTHRKSSHKVISMENKVILITGANAGIGLETARQLLSSTLTLLFNFKT